MQFQHGPSITPRSQGAVGQKERVASGDVDGGRSAIFERQ